MAQYVLTLDLGSSGLRADVVSIDGWSVVATASRRYRTTRSRDGLAQSFTPSHLRRQIVDALAEAIQASGARSDDIDTMSVTAQRGGTAFLDDTGSTLYIGPNGDMRAIFQGGSIDDKQRNNVYATTGHLPSSFFVPAKLHWWRQHRARIARHIATVASLGAWCAYQLTGNLAETSTTMIELGLADMATGLPASKLLEQLNVSLDLLPTTVSPAEPIGHLTGAIAPLVGLHTGIQVFLAGPDTQIAALAAGAIEDGDTAIIAGWSAPVLRVTEAPTLDDQQRTWVSSHIVVDRWLTEANPGDTGATFDMVRGMLGRRITPERFSALATAAPADVIPAFAFWGPRALDLSNPGMSIGGLLTPSPITHEGLAASSIARATFENIAFAIRECLEVINSVTGPFTRTVALTGGMSVSPFFVRTLATTLAIPIRLYDSRSSAIGAAIVASMPESQWRGAVKLLTDQAQIVEPGFSNILEAADRYARWLTLREHLDALAEAF